jgi:hypothetical protein
LLFALALAGALAGCGFHLRGEVSYAFSTLFINSPADVPFTGELKRALGGTGTTLVDNAAAAQVIFDVSRVTDDKQVPRRAAGAPWYLLTKRGHSPTTPKVGSLPAAESSSAAYTFSESEVLRAREEARHKEMQTTPCSRSYGGCAKEARGARRAAAAREAF